MFGGGGAESRSWKKLGKKINRYFKKRIMLHVSFLSHCINFNISNTSSDNVKESESRDCPRSQQRLKRASAVCCSETDLEHLRSSDEEEAQRCSTSG